MHMHEHGDLERFAVAIFENFMSLLHTTPPLCTPCWKRNEQGCCAVLSFTLTLRGDQTTVAGKSLRNNAVYFF